MKNSQKAFEELLKSQPYFNFLTGNDAMKFGFENGFKAAIEFSAKVCDKIAGNTADNNEYKRKGAGQCGALIRLEGKS